MVFGREIWGNNAVKGFGGFVGGSGDLAGYWSKRISLFVSFNFPVQVPWFEFTYDRF